MHQIGGLAPVAEPAPQGLVRDVRPHSTTQPECIDNTARRVIQAERVDVVQLHPDAPHLECGGIELMPVHRRGHDGLPRTAGYRNVMNGRDDVSQLVPGQRRQQAHGRLTCFRRDLDQVVVSRLLIGAPVQPVPDPLNRARGLQALKAAPRQPVSCCRTRTVRSSSSLTAASRHLSGLDATAFTQPAWPVSVLARCEGPLGIRRACRQDGTVKAAVMPPSIGKADAVTKPASSLARYATVPASSSTVPKRPIG